LAGCSSGQREESVQIVAATTGAPTTETQVSANTTTSTAVTTSTTVTASSTRRDLQKAWDKAITPVNRAFDRLEAALKEKKPVPIQLAAQDAILVEQQFLAVLARFPWPPGVTGQEHLEEATADVVVAMEGVRDATENRDGWVEVAVMVGKIKAQASAAHVVRAQLVAAG
jgi:ribosome-associated translation inhibitor RaiA